MDLQTRAKNILLTPNTEWPVIAGEQTSTGALITGYVMPLAAIGAVAGFIGGSIVGTTIPFVGTYRAPILAGLTTAVFMFVMAIVGVLILAFIIDALAPTFGPIFSAPDPTSNCVFSIRASMSNECVFEPGRISTTFPMSAALADTLYNLALDFERKRQFNKAESVFQHIAGINPKFRDIEQKTARAKKLSETVILGGGGGGHPGGTMILDSGSTEKPMLGRYQVEKELGKGAMGVVYMGKDPKINRTVAIKTMALSQEFEADELADVKARFFREAETAGRLNHPNIIQGIDVGESYGSPAGQRLQSERQVLDRAGEDADRVERLGVELQSDEDRDSFGDRFGGCVHGDLFVDAQLAGDGCEYKSTAGADARSGSE